MRSEVPASAFSWFHSVGMRATTETAPPAAGGARLLEPVPPPDGVDVAEVAKNTALPACPPGAQCQSDTPPCRG